MSSNRMRTKMTKSITLFVSSKYNRIIAKKRHQMKTMSALLALCEGDSPVTGEFPSQKPVTHSFDIFFQLRLNKRLTK